MTISKQQQTDNIDEALRMMLRIVGDQNVDDIMFPPDDARLQGTLTTSWEHLEVNNFLKAIGMFYRLTPDGWVKALDAAGELCGPAMKDKLGILCAKVKNTCDAGGARHRDRTTIEDLSNLTGFSAGWISNVISGHLIKLCLNQVECEWEPDDDNKNYVIIPARFGMKL
jgi:hypothetical protein